MIKSISGIMAILFIFAACGDTASPPPELYLSSLSLDAGNLTPTFNQANTNYSLHVDGNVSSVTVDAVPAESDNEVIFSPSNIAALAIGSNCLSVSVVSPDGRYSNTYNIHVFRDAYLTDLSIENLSITPVFNSSITSYYTRTSSLPMMWLKATGAPGTTVIFSPASLVDLPWGESRTITVRVDSQDKTVSREYSVTGFLMFPDIISSNIGTLKYIPSGSFQRGTKTADISKVSEFYIGEKEITRTQFKAVMGYDPSITSNSSGMSDPVQNVNWYAAVEFCNKLSIKEGRTPFYTISGRTPATGYPITGATVAVSDWSGTGYRLPTEMEWMWAAMGAGMKAHPNETDRTGYTKPFAGSTGYNTISSCSWNFYNNGYPQPEKTIPAGSRLANEIGLYDMSGNIREWCWDWFGSNGTYNYDCSGTVEDYRGPASGTRRIARGGCWFDFNAHCSIADRLAPTPVYDDSTYGFRVARY